MKLPFVGGMVAGCLSTVGLISFTKLGLRNSEAPVDDYQQFTKSPKAPIVSRSSGEENSRVDQVLSFGWPSGGRIQRKLKNYVLEYDCARKIPVWVAEHLTVESLKGSANRQAARFKMDPSIPEEFSAQNSDYRSSGWSRGHMSPAGNQKMSQESMDETFYLTNIVPQDIQNNGGFWNRFEIFCRDLTGMYEDVWVTSGPLFLPTQQEDGRKMVTYEVIGENEVSVPTHLYKVIVARSGNDTVAGSFVVPNKPIDYSHHLKEFQVSLDYLEKRVGIKFYTNMKRDEAKDLCEDTGCNLLSKTQMDQLIFTQRLKRVNSLQKLIKLWKEIQEREIHIDTKIQELYQKRLLDLSRKDSEMGNLVTAVQTVEVPCQEVTTIKPLSDMDSTFEPQISTRVGASG
ncbi:nuclease EXOG, mitochondrial isoform X2 [Procambarus clarkii]|nr:nuclease EXOG, mitochondrial-like isoform X2 [Procambarus clarkii]XP_045582471.1 nuclease EXOG, mitochondrial-like isoform X2 [Procambarus clarkii]XP_045582478.1 nuclease EXOG, mitochondrial-like isoform X2 [Procambarus clarkii]XP_045582486.1 nuclease EXOG, mitochondrial-like isoform X2 [Procambarus clarkii]XP_045582495.1 nuclease EXOG, mitochondrial-like isoform X2 [Procambarus clarkii]XP_045582502.1 nuclease EXOG, mitochondrial-like isoform X2 [Procambarus clarkii]XP_045582510.1 nuclease